MTKDGTDALCTAIYGSPAEPRDYLGGSDARMLFDAVSYIESLESFVRDIRDNFDCDSDAHKYGTTCRCCEAMAVIENYPRRSSLMAFKDTVISLIEHAEAIAEELTSEDIERLAEQIDQAAKDSVELTRYYQQGDGR